MKKFFIFCLMAFVMCVNANAQLSVKSSTTKDDYLVYEQFLKDRKTQLRFYTRFLPVEQSGFQTLQPAWNAFIGFKKGE